MCDQKLRQGDWIIPRMCIVIMAKIRIDSTELSIIKPYTSTPDAQDFSYLLCHLIYHITSHVTNTISRVVKA